MTDSGVTLPDRITVLTCLGCGAMGRQERCEGACSEHKLVLVSAAEYDALLAAAHTARERAAVIAPVAHVLTERDTRDAWLKAQEEARRTLRELPRATPPSDWASPGTVTGWWCARCGNVDLPQPCIGVCVWRPADWVNLELYERQLRRAEPLIRSARNLSGLLTRVATVTPRAGQWQRNRDALRRQARGALEGYLPDALPPDTPPTEPHAEAEPPARLHSWPR